jgi:hypothetical protein
VAAAGGKISAALKRGATSATRFFEDCSTLRQEFFGWIFWLLSVGAFSSLMCGVLLRKGAKKPN